jgi:hypothetical protein
VAGLFIMCVQQFMTKLANLRVRVRVRVRVTKFF